MNEIEYLMAILNAICGLAERLTGERMEVLVYPKDDGSPLVIFGDGVRWVPSSRAVFASRSDQTQESLPKSPAIS
jgi:hypothetical protein